MVPNFSSCRRLNSVKDKDRHNEETIVMHALSHANRSTLKKDNISFLMLKKNELRET